TASLAIGPCVLAQSPARTLDCGPVRLRCIHSDFIGAERCSHGDDHNGVALAEIVASSRRSREAPRLLRLCTFPSATRDCEMGDSSTAGSSAGSATRVAWNWTGPVTQDGRWATVEFA